MGFRLTVKLPLSETKPNYWCSLTGSEKSWIYQLLFFIISLRYFEDHDLNSWSGILLWCWWGIFSWLRARIFKITWYTQIFVRQLIKLMQNESALGIKYLYRMNFSIKPKFGKKTKNQPYISYTVVEILISCYQV